MSEFINLQFLLLGIVALLAVSLGLIGVIVWVGGLYREFYDEIRKGH